MDSPPPIVEDLALGAFRLVKQSLDLELDFSAETLPILDHYLISLREEDDGTPEDNVVSVVAPCVGAYFGEVARRTLHELSWVLPEDGHEYRLWRLEGTRTSLSFNPIGAALEAIFGESLAEWNAHLALPMESRALVDRALSATAPVREADFYRLAVRHEVLEQALSVLRHQ